MSGDNQARQRRKVKRKQKQDEPTATVDKAKPKDKKIKQKKPEKKDQDQGTSWVSKIEILILVAIVSGLVALVAIEYRADLEARFSDYGISDYLKGWIGEPGRDQKLDETSFKVETTDRNEEKIIDLLRNENDFVETEKVMTENENREEFSNIVYQAAAIDDKASENIIQQRGDQDPNYQDHEEEEEEEEEQIIMHAEVIAVESKNANEAKSLDATDDSSELDDELQETPEASMKGSDLKDRVDELVDVYNEIAEILGKEKEVKEPLATSHAEPDADDIFEEDGESDNKSGDQAQHHEEIPETMLLSEETITTQEESLEVPSQEENFDEVETDSQESDAAENLDHYPEIKLLYEHAKRLDAKAEKERSNSILTEALAAFQDLLFNRGHKLNDTIFREIADRSIERMRFVGKLKTAVAVHKKLIERFEDEVDHRTQLAITYLLGNHLSVAKLVLHETLTRWPSNGLALVHYGFVLKQLDQDYVNAIVYLKEGIDTFEPGTQDGRLYFNLGDALQRLGRSDEARQVYRKGAEMGLFLSEYQRSLYNVDRLESRPFWTKVQTTYKDDLMEIQKYWQLIRDEGLKLLTKDGTFTNEAENLKDTGDWKQFELYARGMKSKQCSLAPITCKILEKFTAAATCKRGQVKFSVLHPGTHVHPHCGPTNCRVRCHLGLKVPENTFIRVGDSTKSWAEGEWLIFDDSFEHEVWHNGTGTRLVLIVDVWHPDLTEDEKDSMSLI